MQPGQVRISYGLNPHFLMALFFLSWSEWVSILARLRAA